jgi:hypothetical protein
VCEPPGVTTRGKAFEYYHLLCKRGGSYDEFMLNCLGGTINDTAKEVTKAVITEGRHRDAQQSIVTKIIVEAISKPRPFILHFSGLINILVDKADKSGNKKLTHHQEKTRTCPRMAAWGACEACERADATRCAWKRTNATRCARERSARMVSPVNKKVDVSRARTMMHGGWHARSGARHNEHATSAYELRI